MSLKHYHADMNEVWASYRGGIQLLLTRVGPTNDAFRKATENRMGPFKRQMENQTLDNDVARKLMAQTYADAVVKDWRTQTGLDGEGKPKFEPWVEDLEGNKLPYSHENVVKVLSSFPDFFRAVQDDAMDIRMFQKAEVEAHAKN